MSVFAVAPSVQYTERDATLFTKAEYNVNAAMAGVARWGQTEEPISINNGELDLAAKLFTPNDETYLDFFVMADYLRYSQEGTFLRMVGENARNAVNKDATEAIYVPNKAEFENMVFPADVNFVGRCAGSLGNSLSIAVIDETTYDTSPVKDVLNYKPKAGERSVVVLDSAGEITGGQAASNQAYEMVFTGSTERVTDYEFGGHTYNFSAYDSAAEMAAKFAAQLPTNDSDVESASVVNTTTGGRAIYRLQIDTAPTTDGTIRISGVDVDYTAGETPAVILGKVRDAIDVEVAANTPTMTVTAVHVNGNNFMLMTRRVGGLRDGVNTLLHTIPADLDATLTQTNTGADVVSTVEVKMKAGIQKDIDQTVTPIRVDEGSAKATETSTSFIGTPIEGEVYELLQLTVGSKNSLGANAYFYSVINNNSNWFYVTDRDSLDAGIYELGKGVDDYNVDRTAGYQELQNAEKYDVSLAIGVPHTVGEQQAAIDCSVTRRDCITFTSPLMEHIVGARGKQADNVLAWRNNQLLRDNSYFFMDDNWAVVYDKYNDTERWIPCCGGTAGLYARSIALEGPWKSPAFLNRGKYKGYRRMAWSAGPTERKNLYRAGINSIITRKEGVVLWGDKTGLSRPSAFDRINVRGTFIMMEKNIADMAVYFLGENNNEFTRALFLNTVRPYIRQLEGRQAIIEGRVKCDETNNTGQVIAGNQMKAGIWVKPQYSINYIFLDFAALRPDMSFEEIEGGGGLTTAD